MSEKDIEGKKILERADKITNRLFKALYSEEVPYINVCFDEVLGNCSACGPRIRGKN